MRNCSQSVEVAPAPAPATTKRRVRVKSKKTVNNVTQDAPAEDPPVGGTARRGKTKSAASAETEEESTGTGTSNPARCPMRQAVEQEQVPAAAGAKVHQGLCYTLQRGIDDAIPTIQYYFANKHPCLPRSLPTQP